MDNAIVNGHVLPKVGSALLPACRSDIWELWCSLYAYPCERCDNVTGRKYMRTVQQDSINASSPNR